MLSLHPLYDRVTAAIFDYEDDSLVFKELLPQPKEDPKLGWRQGLEASQRAMADQAARRHLTNVRPYGLSYIPEFGVYSYSVRTDQDIRDHGWDTGVWVDADTGAFRKLFLPSGLHAGNTLTNLLWALHYGDFRGSILFRLLVCLFGFILVLLSGTGVYVWWRKRQITKRGMARARCVVAAD